MSPKHYQAYCKYDKSVEFPALILGVCERCREALCSACGYWYPNQKEGFKYCNECYEEEKKIDTAFSKV